MILSLEGPKPELTSRYIYIGVVQGGGTRWLKGRLGEVLSMIPAPGVPCQGQCFSDCFLFSFFFCIFFLALWVS